MAESPHSFDATIENFQEKVIDASMQVPVVVDVWADWCEPCKQLMPVLARLAEEYKGQFLLAKVNADEQQQLAMHLGVRSLPTVKIVKEGRLVDEFNGALPESQVREVLERHVSAPPESPLEQGRRLWKEGQLDEALAVLTEANRANPDDTDILIDIAQIKAEKGDLAGAREILDALPREETFNAHARQLEARLKFLETAGDLPDAASLEARLEKDPDDLEAMHQLAMHKALKGENATAMDLLFRLLQKDRNFGDGKARTTLLELFDLLGNEDPDVRQYRRRLYTLMY